jgi:ferrochelatase
LPLFPQYSSTTTAAAFDGLAKTLRQWHNLPEIVFIRDYWREGGYLQALADSIQQLWNQHGRAEKLIFSFHGIPQSYVDAGDPYPNACMATASAVAQKLRLHQDQWLVAFQSRFGKRPWTRPYTDEILVELGQQGVRQADIVCPGFSVDCLETLEEVNIRYRECFAEHGGTLRYIPALGAAPALIETFAHRLGAKLA